MKGVPKRAYIRQFNITTYQFPELAIKVANNEWTCSVDVGGWSPHELPCSVYVVADSSLLSLSQSSVSQALTQGLSIGRSLFQSQSNMYTQILRLNIDTVHIQSFPQIMHLSIHPSIQPFSCAISLHDPARWSAPQLHCNANAMPRQSSRCKAIAHCVRQSIW